jgi:predicted N-acetyltransferase YhbS
VRDYPELPAIEGLTFRPVHGEQDADAVYALRAGCIERDQVDLLATQEGLPSREEMSEALAELAAAQHLDRRLVAEVDGQVVGYTLIDCWHEDDGRWVYLILGWVLPTWRGKGIGTAMLRWGEQTARRLAAEEHPGERFELAGNASSRQPEATGLLLNEGYTAGYTMLEMGLDFAAVPPVCPLPPGVEVRPALPEHIPLIADSIGEAYRDEYADNRFHETWKHEESIERLSAPRQDPALWQIAWAGEQVVGNVIPLIEKGRALMYDISVRPAWRRQGLARALLTRALWDLRARGVQVIRLSTVAEFRTRARDLYTSVGFRVLNEHPRYRKSPE